MSNTELKPCPFCGGKAVLHVSEGVCVICTECETRTITLVDSMVQGKYSGGAINRVVEKWNRRVTMAYRHTLHISKLEEFKEWLVADGWEILPTSNNAYEVLRAKKPSKQFPLIVYCKGNSQEHLSVADRDMPVIRAFLRESKTSKTNADHIRSMRDEELAMNMMCPNENGLAEIECDKSDSCNCYECLLNWLQSEREEDNERICNQ